MQNMLVRCVLHHYFCLLLSAGSCARLLCTVCVPLCSLRRGLLVTYRFFVLERVMGRVPVQTVCGGFLPCVCPAKMLVGLHEGNLERLRSCTEVMIRHHFFVIPKWKMVPLVCALMHIPCPLTPHFHLSLPFFSSSFYPFHVQAHHV